MKINNYLWTFLIAVVAVRTGNGLPIKDAYPGHDNELVSNVLVRRFYGPWNNIQKINGDYTEYGDYGVHVQDYRPSSEDVPADEPSVAEGPVADFPSNYGAAGVETDTGYDPSQAGSASFETGDSTGDAQANYQEDTSGDVSQDSQSADSHDYGNYHHSDESSNEDQGDHRGSEEYNHEEAEGNVHWTSPI